MTIDSEQRNEMEEIVQYFKSAPERITEAKNTKEVAAVMKEADEKHGEALKLKDAANAKAKNKGSSDDEKDTSAYLNKRYTAVTAAYGALGEYATAKIATMQKK